MPSSDNAESAPRPFVLLIGRDDFLVDDVARISAACGLELVVARTPSDGRRRWSSAGVVLVADDVLDEVAQAEMGRRGGVVVLRRGGNPRDGSDATSWRRAVEIGAEHVVELPDGEDWLVSRCAELVDGANSGGPIISVVGARGGVGASTVACLLSLCVPRDVLLVDIDPFGGGLDLRLDADEVSGLRWTDLAATRGRISSSALRAALPAKGEIWMAVPSREAVTPLTSDPVAAVIDAGARGFSATIVDCPRSDSEICRLAWGRSSTTLIVTSGDLEGLVSAHLVADVVRPLAADVQIVLRTGRRAGLGSLDRWEIEDSLGLPVVGVIGDAAPIGRGDLASAARSAAVRKSVESILASCAITPRRRSRRLAS